MEHKNHQYKNSAGFKYVFVIQKCKNVSAPVCFHHILQGYRLTDMLYWSLRNHCQSSRTEYEIQIIVNTERFILH